MSRLPVPTLRGRRVFMMQASCALSAAAMSAPSFAQGTPKRVDEADENAVALGYKHDSTKVDKAKFPQHDSKQVCANCQFWQGSATDEWAGCAMFGRKQIAAKGWCTAWRKVG